MSKKTLKLLSSLLGTIVLVVVYFGNAHGWFGTTTGAKSGVQSAATLPGDPGLYPIDHFIDGDTIAVKMNGKTESIRMVGVDTPETHKPNTPVQCYGPAAAAFTKSLISSGRVRLAADPDSTNRDRYNRLLRYVYIPDGRMVETELIKGGYGFAYTEFPFTKSAEFTADQNAAKTAGKGLWGNCKPFQESSGRWQTENAG
ncbi:MAG TPA: thermonuclease family protein [Candidatus Saccharimonadales bacterium]|nr:thermonuclease family protein [Candidatus Saccharimonadales bacterium]